MNDHERELKMLEEHNPEASKLPQWHSPELKKISVRETLNHVGSGGDAGHSTSL
jgi:hypothetical protein